ncbi:MAG: dUTP diphosphatase [Melioribacter sp.]|nr:dUTP diphosphatase [Melioribacter sp.]
MSEKINLKNFVLLLREYERLSKIIDDKWKSKTIWFTIITVVILISFVILEISRLGNFGKILLPILFIILTWQIYMLSKNYNDNKLFIILSTLLGKYNDGFTNYYTLENSERLKIKVKRISENFKDIPLPEYATDGSSGLDIRAAIDNELIIPKGSFVIVPTNLKVEIPDGYEMQVRPRSGLAAKYGIGLLNSPGTIDSDYRGELKIILFNFGKEDFVIKRGDRIAQLVLSKVTKAYLVESDNLSNSNRNEGGFGHTGLS